MQIGIAFSASTCVSIAMSLQMLILVGKSSSSAWESGCFRMHFFEERKRERERVLEGTSNEDQCAQMVDLGGNVQKIVDQTEVLSVSPKSNYFA